MSDREDDYEVGYGKPPKSGQFKKGLSGNPKGRPKGAKGVKASLRRELESRMSIREDGREISVSKAEIIAKRLTTDAIKGNGKAQLELLRLDNELFGDGSGADEGKVPSSPPEPVDYDILRDFLREQTDPDEGESDDCT